MADISAEIAAFRDAIYGEEVRGSMISLAEKLNDVSEDTEATVDSFETNITAAITAANEAATNANSKATAANTAASSANAAADGANAAADGANSAAESATAQATAASNLITQAQSAEQARATAENERRTAETVRASAESARANAETNRASNEVTRQDNETARNSAEAARVTAESGRASNETQRNNAETNRNVAETNRASAFRAIQDAWQDMEQQVLPPATTSTIGGIIVGDGLTVQSDGTLSFEAGDVLTKSEAAETYATITTVEGKSDVGHVHSTADLTSGTLPVNRGGTGVTTAAAERERLGLGSTTDALPVANGGTGATTKADARSSLDVVACSDQSAMNASLSSLTAATQIWGIWANCTNEANTEHSGNRVGLLLYNDGILLYDGSSRWKLSASTTTTTTVASIIAAASGISITDAQYAERNGVAMLRFVFKATSDKSASFNIGTVVSGKRPAIISYGSFTSDKLTYINVNTTGLVTGYGTPTTNTSYSVGFTYILA